MTISKISKDYKTIFYKYWGLSKEDSLSCWGCFQRPAIEIHHLKSRGFGGSPKNLLNVPRNLFPVCRQCHTLAHSNRAVNEEFKKELNQKIDEKEFEENENGI